MGFWRHIHEWLPGVRLRHFSTTCAVYIEDCEGWSCPSHSHDTDMLHVPTLPRHHADDMSTVQWVVVIATRLRTRQWENKKQRHPRNKLRGCNKRETSELLHTCASLLVSPCILGFHMRPFFSPVTSHKPFFTFSYISTLHSGQDLRTRNAYRCA